MTMKKEYGLQTGQTGYGPTEKPKIEIQNGRGQRVLDLNQHGQHSLEERLVELFDRVMPVEERVWIQYYIQC